MALFLCAPSLPVVPGDALSRFCSGFASGWLWPSEEGTDEAQGGTLRPPGEDLRAQMKHRWSTDRAQMETRRGAILG